MKFPKVMVAMPTADKKDYCVDDFIKQIKTFTYPLYDILILDNSQDKEHVNTFRDRGIKAIHEPISGDFRKELARCQNIIRENFLNSDCDYLLMIESDVFTGECIIENLVGYAMAYQASIVTATYEIRKEEENVLCLTSTTDQRGVRSERLLKRHHGFDIMGQGCIPIRHLLVDVDSKITATGIGCTLFVRDVMEEVKFRTDLKVNKSAFSDSFIFTDAAKLGHQILIQSNLICEHRK